MSCCSLYFYCVVVREREVGRFIGILAFRKKKYGTVCGAVFRFFFKKNIGDNQGGIDVVLLELQLFLSRRATIRTSKPRELPVTKFS